MIQEKSPASLSRQCQILEIYRSRMCYKPVPVNGTDLQLMRLIDKIHLIHPYFGARRISGKLCDMGEKVGRKHVRTLMNKKRRTTAIYNKPRLSKRNRNHRIYPYLLRGMPITRANHVWAADITYIPMARGSGRPGSYYGLGKSENIIMAVIKHSGCWILPGGFGRSRGQVRSSRDFQYGSGISVYI